MSEKRDIHPNQPTNNQNPVKNARQVIDDTHIHVGKDLIIQIYSNLRTTMAASQLTRIALLCLFYVQASFAYKVPKEGYDADFFSQHLDNADVYPLLVTMIGNTLLDWGVATNSPPFSVVDVGCGHGLLVEAWRSAGVADSYCLEGSPFSKPMWPKQEGIQDKYYQIQDLTEEAAITAMPRTNLVTSFEVAEHLPEDRANHFVYLLTMHGPDVVVFGAATIDQDGPRNPTHVNENSFDYWIEKFENSRYLVDLAATAILRHRLVAAVVTNPEFKKYTKDALLYPKNLLVFVKESSEHTQMELDRKLLSHPKEADLLNESYLGILGPGANRWRIDWMEFGRIFYTTQAAARGRQEKREHDEL
jgi:2-polyprenyl-3-methyl-5-hydroxy-6-metoxy-1,4-benzoquinol methylase